jgi:hypothetical protein
MLSVPAGLQKKYSFLVDNPTIPFHTVVQQDDNDVPEKTLEQERDSSGKLCNRLILCVFAICLLWLTSLQMCVGIVGTNLAVPLLSSVVGTCQFAYDQVVEQRDFYSACSQQQMSTCTKSLQAAHLAESVKAAAQGQFNAQFVSDFKSQVNNCSDAYLDGKKAVNAWTGSGVHYTIPYQTTCGSTAKQSVATLLGDTSESRVSVLAASEQFAFSSDSSVLRLAAYGSALTAYNAEYVYNKTSQLQSLSKAIVAGVAVPGLEIFDTRVLALEGTIQQLAVCTGMGNYSNVCLYGTTLRSKYETLRATMAKQLEKIEEKIEEVEVVVDVYAGKVEAAIAAADSFYDSVAGATGLVSWVVSNTGVTQLCGKGSPNWCSFSKVG